MTPLRLQYWLVAAFPPLACAMDCFSVQPQASTCAKLSVWASCHRRRGGLHLGTLHVLACACPRWILEALASSHSTVSAMPHCLHWSHCNCPRSSTLANGHQCFHATVCQGTWLIVKQWPNASQWASHHPWVIMSKKRTTTDVSTVAPA